MKNMVKRLFSHKTIERFKKKNTLLGIKNKTTYLDDLSLYLLVIITTLVISIILCYHRFYLIIVLPVASALIFEYLYYDLRLAKRKALLNKQALFFFQILSLTLESGNNLKGAIELTTSSVSNELSDEFKKALSDIKMGSTMNESLLDLEKRIPSEVISNIILNLTESSVYGSDMIKSLNTQIDYLNNKLILSVREQINKMPIKISIVSVLLFIPIILLIILSPLIIELIGM
ncbi:MAG: type II secretion system F family protein [bacterium]|nr:type II secretion system F family protein [bacterium]